MKNRGKIMSSNKSLRRQKKLRSKSRGHENEEHLEEKDDLSQSLSS